MKSKYRPNASNEKFAPYGDVLKSVQYTLDVKYLHDFFILGKSGNDNLD